jgi:glycosyltransferase involved in cell wall biosynthesis
MQIIKIGTSKKGYGGNIYEQYLDKILSENFDYKTVFFDFKFKGAFRLLEIFRYLSFCWKYSRNKNFFLIRNFNNSIFPLKNNKNALTIVYHIDETGSKFLVSIYQKILENLFFLQAKNDDAIVVIGEYWKQYFAKKNFTNVHTLYCPYNMSLYNINKEDALAWKRKYFTDEKPLIYLGNPQEKKGFLTSYKIASRFDAHLVSSGEGDLTFPKCKHMKLKFNEFLILLSISDVVLTMSKFKEGWCRVAHEALLLNRPVVGSGEGGMRELLTYGGGLIATSEDELYSHIKNILNSNKSAFSSNQEYLRQFDENYFKKSLIEILMKTNSSLNLRSV